MALSGMGAVVTWLLTITLCTKSEGHRREEDSEVNIKTKNNLYIKTTSVVCYRAFIVNNQQSL